MNTEQKVTTLSAVDRERLEAASQTVDLAHQSLTELYKYATPLLAEYALDLLEPLGKINQKLQRMVSITK